MNHLVSAVIPTYNEEENVVKCIKSLESQSYKNIEIVFVDSSTDKTYEKIKEIAKKNKKIKVFKRPLNGTGRARNFGVNESKGEIILFVDADMTFDKEYVKNLTEPIIKDEKIIGTTHDYEIAINANNKWSYLWGRIRVSKENAKDVKIFRAIRKNKFLELGGIDPKYGYADDQTFWFKYGIKPVVAKNTTCYHVNPPTLKETYKQARWIGGSWKEKWRILRIPALNSILSLVSFLFLPGIAFMKALKKTDLEIPFRERFTFYLYKFKGYFTGLFRSIFLNKNWH